MRLTIQEYNSLNPQQKKNLSIDKLPKEYVIPPEIIYSIIDKLNKSQIPATPTTIKQELNKYFKRFQLPNEILVNIFKYIPVEGHIVNKSIKQLTKKDYNKVLKNELVKKYKSNALLHYLFTKIKNNDTPDYDLMIQLPVPNFRFQDFEFIDLFVLLNLLYLNPHLNLTENMTLN